MQQFKPTYLYIKQHSITGKLYFGKTTSSDPLKYMGSGSDWTKHIKQHGKEHIVTLWYELFQDKELIQEFALDFSKKLNIVESTSWLNKIPENGVGVLGGNHTSSISSPKQSTLDICHYVGKRLKEIRKSRKISQQTMCDNIGISRVTLNRIENFKDDMNVSFLNIIKIAQELDIDDEILDLFRHRSSDEQYYGC